jgi:hypothetical protein
MARGALSMTHTTRRQDEQRSPTQEPSRRRRAAAAAAAAPAATADGQSSLQMKLDNGLPPPDTNAILTPMTA